MVLLPFLQSSEQKALQALEEQKRRADMQHEGEITALSSNLASLRQQVENGRRKAEEMEATVSSQSHQIQGEEGRGGVGAMPDDKVLLSSSSVRQESSNAR